MTVIGEATVVRDARQWLLRRKNGRDGALHELNRSILTDRYAVRLAKLPGEMHGVNVHRVRECGDGDSELRIVEDTPHSR